MVISTFQKKKPRKRMYFCNCTRSWRKAVDQALRSTVTAVFSLSTTAIFYLAIQSHKMLFYFYTVC